MKNLEEIKAIIEYQIANSQNGDYILQTLILKDMCPNGWN
jgi:hypothetical protein